MMVKVGDKVTRTPRTITELAAPGSTALAHKPMKGEVIYIHPKGRFHVVEFTNALGVKMRESFWGVNG